MEIRTQFSGLQSISITLFFKDYLSEGKVGKHAFIYTTNPLSCAKNCARMCTQSWSPANRLHHISGTHSTSVSERLESVWQGRTHRDREVIQLQTTTSLVSSQMEALGICRGEKSAVLCFNRQFYSKHLQEAKPFFLPKLQRPLFIQLCYHVFHKILEAVVRIWCLLSRFVFLINILASLILYLKVKEMIWEHRKQNFILRVLIGSHEQD